MSSPWAKVEPSEAANFVDIMSKEYVCNQKKKRMKERKEIKEQNMKDTIIQREYTLEQKGIIENSSSENDIEAIGEYQNCVSIISGSDVHGLIGSISLLLYDELLEGLQPDELEENDYVHNVFYLNFKAETIADHDEDFCTINAYAMDNDLPDSFTNRIKISSRKSKKDKLQRDKKATSKSKIRLNYSTRSILYELVKANILKRVTGIISEGKDSLILHADSDPSNVLREFAIKVFKSSLKEIEQRNFYNKGGKQYKNYLTNDNGGASIDVRAKKEMLIIKRLQEFKIPCPNIVSIKKHIVVMSLIGDNRSAAPKLKFAQLSEVQLSEAYQQIIENMHVMYNKVRLIHGNLSEYNILWYFGKCWFVDFSQSIEANHPLALTFLMRDCNNVISYFQKFGLPNMKTKETLFEYICSLSADSYKSFLLNSTRTGDEL